MTDPHSLRSRPRLTTLHNTHVAPSLASLASVVIRRKIALHLLFKSVGSPHL